jgi:hypothetical protein
VQEQRVSSLRPFYGGVRLCGEPLHAGYTLSAARLLNRASWAAVFLDEPADAVAAFAGALGAFDAQNVELALEVAKDEI